jgi:hypothetical protein
VLFDVKDAPGLRLAQALPSRGSVRIAFSDSDDLYVLVFAFALDPDGPGGLEAIGLERFRTVSRQPCYKVGG